MSGAGRVVIVGAGHAGTSAAAFLRQNRWAGEIVLLDEQGVSPYHRPVLSKAWLTQAATPETALLRPASFYERNAIDLRLDHGVSFIDRQHKRVHLADGGSIQYDAAILACGARPREVPLRGAELQGVLSLRTMADADRIAVALKSGPRLVILGGGYIGLEVAAAARTHQVDVVLLEREERLLARVASPRISRYFEDLHRRNGVDIRLNSTLCGIEGRLDRVSAVELVGGVTIACDHVLVAAGAQPNDELARACGLACENGVVVDGQARTSDPSIFAIGDMTFRPLPHYGIAMRLESVANALEQAKQAACAIAAATAPAPEVPWFWSDQYQVKLQIAGIIHDADQSIERHHESGGLSVFHLRDGVVRCVEAIDAAQDFMGGKMLIGSARSVDMQQLADASVSLKSIVASGHAST